MYEHMYIHIKSIAHKYIQWKSTESPEILIASSKAGNSFDPGSRASDLLIQSLMPLYERSRMALISLCSKPSSPASVFLLCLSQNPSTPVSEILHNSYISHIRSPLAATCAQGGTATHGCAGDLALQLRDAWQHGNSYV